jgi:3-oxoacyl-[acyl-carrier-protein] synthase-3
MSAPILPSVGPFGVRIAGTGSAVPAQVLTNADLARMVETDDDWIFQRTGIRERRISNPETEGTYALSREALKAAIAAAKIDPTSIDLVICGTCTMEMTCPSTACRVAAAVGAMPAAAFDLVAACCGFVYSLNVADALVRSGSFRTVAVIGCDAMSTAIDYTDRGTSILFGDAAGAAILTRDPDRTKGCMYQHMGADGRDWSSLYIPRRQCDVPAKDAGNTNRMAKLRMEGREVFKFAVNKFREVIEDAMAKTNLGVNDIGQVICHQSNVRIIDAARERIGFDPAQVYVNIDRFGNSSAGSVGLCFDQLWKAGKVPCEKPVVFVAFGGGLTWASSVWQL